MLDREQGRLCAVLLDYFMPGLTPCDCARAILSKSGAEVRVVLMSAAVDIAARAREVGISRFLAKPFEPGELRDVVGAGRT